MLSDKLKSVEESLDVCLLTKLEKDRMHTYLEQKITTCSGVSKIIDFISHTARMRQAVMQ